MSPGSPHGGFSLANQTLSTPLINLVEITVGPNQFNVSANPCPLHYEMEDIRRKFSTVFRETTIGDLVKDSKNDFIKSLSTN